MFFFRRLISLILICVLTFSLMGSISPSLAMGFTESPVNEGIVSSDDSLNEDDEDKGEECCNDNGEIHKPDLPILEVDYEPAEQPPVEIPEALLTAIISLSSWITVNGNMAFMLTCI